MSVSLLAKEYVVSNVTSQGYSVGYSYSNPEVRVILPGLTLTHS